MADRYIADLQSINRLIEVCGQGWEKLRIDRPCLTDYGKATKIGLGSVDGKNPKIVCVSLIHRLCAVDVGQTKELYRQ
jgi:hypothetical protein